MNTISLQHFLQEAGFDSRRNIRRWIHEGRFKINQQTITNPSTLIGLERDQVSYEDRPLQLKREKKSYFIFNKPDGVVSTFSDPQQRPTIKVFLSGIRQRVFPVGRLDFHSEGLMLLTNDGDLANFIISARKKIPKVYLLKIKGILGPAAKKKLTEGIFLDGTRLKPFRIDLIKKTGQGNSWVQVSLVEGKKHILRNAFKYSGHPVEKLKRIAIGTIALKNLPPGHWRELTNQEITFFKKRFFFENKNRERD